jgi:demethylmenaquinone methyltransferase/2-methoxy-6-polyprenyl-1,4-benzoquinol methylase
VERTLREAHRVLKPGGRLLILETSLPGNAVLRTAYLFYLRHILPHVGSTISGDGHAYRYLNQTIEAFPYGEEFCAYLHATGYRKVQATPLTFGVATLYRADKP